MDDLNYNVAVNLKRIRREKGMSLEGMAEQTGVSKSMLMQKPEHTAYPLLLMIMQIFLLQSRSPINRKNSCPLCSNRQKLL